MAMDSVYDIAARRGYEQDLNEYVGAKIAAERTEAQKASLEAARALALELGYTFDGKEWYRPKLEAAPEPVTLSTSSYPEHEKLAAVRAQSQACGEFLEWLQHEKRWQLAKLHGNHSEHCFNSDGDRICDYRRDELEPVRYTLLDLLAEFFEIDRDKLESEKDAMLAALREAQP